jgi:hypothetical protein
VTAAEIAVAIAEEFGFPVFPCAAPTKRPTCPHWPQNASTDPPAIRELWRRYPGNLVGVPTGLATGVDVLDIDPCHGGDRWLAIPRLPVTRTHATHSGGRHFLLACDGRLRNSTQKLAPGVDVRSSGGYVIWWPACGLPVENPNRLAAWPWWLLDVLLPRAPKPRPATTLVVNGDRYVAAAVNQGCRRIRNAPDGSRNNTLNNEALSLARFVATGAIAASELAVALTAAAEATGLGDKEIAATVASAFKARGILS